MRYFTGVMLALLLMAPPTTQAQSAESNDKTLSPYFVVLSESAEKDQLPLQSTSAEVNVSGVIADVHVTQEYRNRGKSPLEALYVFPASTHAAVYAMRMTIGERVIEAKVRERKQAETEYVAAKKEGKSASLLEQQRPNVFQMRVANIMPGDQLKVQLSYTELLVPTEHVYEFVYPTVVGPRYSNQKKAEALPSEHWVQNPYLHSGERSPYAFHFAAHVSGGVPIADLMSPTHKVDVHFENPTEASIGLSPLEQDGGNRDLIVRYRLDGEKIQSGLLLFKGENENFFLSMIEPPKRLEAAQIVPREYIFVVDVSGSMYGFPLSVSKSLLKNLIGGLRPTDRFNVELFSGGSTLLAPASLPATPENIQQALMLIDGQNGGGGTELLPALERALALPRDEIYSRSVLVITDGYVQVEDQAFDLIRKQLGNANLFAFGIGSSVNRHLIEGLAKTGQGEPFVVTTPDEGPRVAAELKEYVEAPLLTGITTSAEGGIELYDIEPKAIPDLFANRPLIQFGKWRGTPQGSVVIRGRQGQFPFEQILRVEASEPRAEHSALKYLWARERIAALGDYGLNDRDPDVVGQITNLGLTYNLLTRFTSFIAVDKEVRTKTPGETVKQPLPLPAGVSDSAVGGGIPSAPEPETWALLLIVLATVSGLMIRDRRFA